MNKIHPWPTRRHPETGRYEVLIAGVWRSRQYAWQVLRRIENKCKICGHDALKKDYPYCRRCARAEAIRRTGKWNGAWEEGRRGCPPVPSSEFEQLLPCQVKR
jgi:hypothetical protein